MIMDFELYRLSILDQGPSMPLYDGAADMAEYVSRAIGDAAKETAMLLYYLKVDPLLEDLKNVDGGFCFDDGPRATTRMVSKAHTRTQRRQTILGAFS